MAGKLARPSRLDRRETEQRNPCRALRRPSETGPGPGKTKSSCVAGRDSGSLPEASRSCRVERRLLELPEQRFELGSGAQGRAEPHRQVQELDFDPVCAVALIAEQRL
jgi:hypothetical protein